LQKEFFQLIASILERQQSLNAERPNSSFLLDLQIPKSGRAVRELWEQQDRSEIDGIVSSSTPISATLNSIRPEVRNKLKHGAIDLPMKSVDLSIPLHIRLKPVITRWSFSRNNSE